jgi:hypothetical protein
MFCAKCGKQIERSPGFCRYCGTQVGQPQATSSRPKKSNKTRNIVIGVIVGVVAVVVVVPILIAVIALAATRFSGPSQVQAANEELHEARVAVECCFAEANAGELATYPAWNGTRITSPTITASGTTATIYASDYLREPHFKATYTFDVNGDLVRATLSPAPGHTAWVGIRWDPGTLSWVKA